MTHTKETLQFKQQWGCLFCNHNSFFLPSSSSTDPNEWMCHSPDSNWEKQISVIIFQYVWPSAKKSTWSMHNDTTPKHVWVFFSPAVWKHPLIGSVHQSRLNMHIASKYLDICEEGKEDGLTPRLRLHVARWWEDGFSQPACKGGLDSWKASEREKEETEGRLVAEGNTTAEVS